MPGKGPFMRSGHVIAVQPIPADSPKWCGPWGAAGGAPFRVQQGDSPILLLKTDGGNAWLEARGLHGSAAWAQERPGQAGGEGAQEDLEERGLPSKEGGFTTDKEGAGIPAVSQGQARGRVAVRFCCVCKEGLGRGDRAAHCRGAARPGQVFIE